ncbi:MAG: hypothetical protein HC857_08710 [Synechococcales cyanobacterium RU_4_20]|nr:hypothetical protein [Synechococcales cyanobacterium RU_4_20]NJR70297.1 hypothetical protein [Synechococcales cyanobacterium CRU_2_2]
MKDSEFDFRPYLNAIATHYSKDGNFYTPTDALLPLEARSVEQEQEGREQRVEEFPVLAGLRKYALGRWEAIHLGLSIIGSQPSRA